MIQTPLKSGLFGNYNFNPAKNRVSHFYILQSLSRSPEKTSTEDSPSLGDQPPSSFVGMSSSSSQLVGVVNHSFSFYFPLLLISTSFLCFCLGACVIQWRSLKVLMELDRGLEPSVQAPQLVVNSPSSSLLTPDLRFCDVKQTKRKPIHSYSPSFYALRWMLAMNSKSDSHILTFCWLSSLGQVVISQLFCS